MEFVISACSDAGIVKKTNQDSVLLMVINTNEGQLAVGVLCDGMGGLAKGEVASAAVINRFERWVYERLPIVLHGKITDEIIKREFEKVIKDSNETIMKYGKKVSIALGTTVVAIIIFQGRYYSVNVGDSRIYELSDEVKKITEDQTVVAKELALGNISEECAKRDCRKNVLLQCVGVTDNVRPDYYFGEAKSKSVFLLCSDGFVHEITEKEIFKYLGPDVALDEKSIELGENILIDVNKKRYEKDNISVAVIRTV